MIKKIVLLFFVICLTSCVGIEGGVGDYLGGGIIDYNLKRYNDSILKLTKAISIDKSNKQAYLVRGHAYAESGDFQKALADYEKVIELFPKNSEAYFYLGVIWDEKKDYEKSIYYYSKAIENDNSYVNAIANRGWVYLRTSKFSMAEDDFRIALQINQRNISAISGMAELYIYRDSDFSSALLFYDKAISINRDDPKLYYLRGVLFVNMKKYLEAASEFSQAISLNPKYMDAYLGRGNCRAEIGDKEKAIKDYTTVIELGGDNVEAYNNRAYTYYELGLYANSLSDYNTAIAISHSNKKLLAEVFYGRSELFAKINKQKEALRDAQSAVELNPDNNKYHEWHRKLFDMLSVPK